MDMKTCMSALAAGLVLAVSSCAQAADNTLTAEEHAAAIEDARGQIPLPPGAVLPERDVRDGEYYEVGLARSIAESDAVCAWFRYWLDTRSSDPEAARAAWEFIAAIPEMSGYAQADPSVHRHMERIIEQASLGDPSGIVREVELNC